MPSFVTVTSGATAQAQDVNQLILAMNGTPGSGIPISLTAVNDSVNFALAVKNADPTNSRSLQVLRANNNVLLQADASGVIASPDGGATTGQIMTVNSTQTVTGAKTFSGDLTARRLKAAGTAIVAGDLSIGAGWGSTATVSIAAGSTDQRGSFTITANGTGLAAFPTMSLTFHDGTWTTAPFVIVEEVAGTGLPGTAVPVATTTVSATAINMTYNSTVAPVAGQSHTFTYLVIG